MMLGESKLYGYSNLLTLTFPKSQKGVLQQDPFFMQQVGACLLPNSDSETRHFLVCFSLENLSIFFLTVLLQNWILQQRDTVLRVKKDCYLSCNYLLARALVQMLEWHLESVMLRFLDPRRFPSWLLAESGSLAVSDLADVEFFSP